MALWVVGPASAPGHREQDLVVSQPVDHPAPWRQGEGQVHSSQSVGCPGWCPQPLGNVPGFPWGEG